MTDRSSPTTSNDVFLNLKPIDSFTCEVCKKTFAVKSSYRKHMKCKHSDDASEVTCDSCGFTAYSRYSLLRHQKRKHSEVSKPKVCISCVLCQKFSSATREEMVAHYVEDHLVNITRKELEFPSQELFYKWKTSVQREQTCDFIRKQSKYTSIVDGSSRMTFQCQRDGAFCSVNNNKPRLRQSRSNKIDGHCPAKMNATFHKTGNVSVDYWETHVGHKPDINRIGLSKEDRRIIADKISAQVPFEKILEDVRSSVSPDSRLHLTKMDLLDIAMKESGSESCEEIVVDVDATYPLAVSSVANDDVKDDKVVDSNDISSEHYVVQEAKVVIQRRGDERERKERLIEQFQNILKESETEEHLNVVENHLAKLLRVVRKKKVKPVVKIICKTTKNNVQIASVKTIVNNPEISVQRTMKP